MSQIHAGETATHFVALPHEKPPRTSSAAELKAAAGRRRGKENSLQEADPTLDQSGPSRTVSAVRNLRTVSRACEEDRGSHKPQRPSQTPSWTTSLVCIAMKCTAVSNPLFDEITSRPYGPLFKKAPHQASRLRINNSRSTYSRKSARSPEGRGHAPVFAAGKLALLEPRP